MGTASPRLFFLFVFTLLLNGVVFSQFPHITVLDLDGQKISLPTNERQLIFISSSTKAQSDLRSWNRELRKKPHLIKDTALRGIAILPEWMGEDLARPLALLYVRSHVPKWLHNSIYVLFANAEKARTLFDLPANTDDEVHLFYLNDTGNILVYTYGAPSIQKINTLATFSEIR